MNLIYEDELKKRFEPNEMYTAEEIWRKIETSRVSNAVTPTLCGDCKHGYETNNGYYCDRIFPRRPVSQDAYCFYGKQR